MKKLSVEQPKKLKPLFLQRNQTSESKRIIRKSSLKLNTEIKFRNNNNKINKIKNNKKLNQEENYLIMIKKFNTLEDPRILGFNNIKIAEKFKIENEEICENIEEKIDYGNESFLKSKNYDLQNTEENNCIKTLESLKINEEQTIMSQEI